LSLETYHAHFLDTNIIMAEVWRFDKFNEIIEKYFTKMRDIDKYSSARVRHEFRKLMEKNIDAFAQFLEGLSDVYYKKGGFAMGDIMNVILHLNVEEREKDRIKTFADIHGRFLIENYNENFPMLFKQEFKNAKNRGLSLLKGEHGLICVKDIDDRQHDHDSKEKLRRFILNSKDIDILMDAQCVKDEEKDIHVIGFLTFDFEDIFNNRNKIEEILDMKILSPFELQN